MDKPTFREALRFWTKLGFISFGGPAGQIAIMHEYLVEKKKWISPTKFLHALNYCMILPGPEAHQLAIYIGWLLHGTLGGLTAGILFLLPSMLILLGLSIIYVSFGNIPYIYAIFNGLKPAVIAIIILALIKIAKKSFLSLFHFFIALVSFLCVFFLNIPFPFIILSTLILGILRYKLLQNFFIANDNSINKTDSYESEYYINKNTVVEHTGYIPMRFLKQNLTFIILWALPIIIFYFFTSSFQFWIKLSVFFTKAAFVTFGGAYAVLPYVAQISVEKYNWLTNFQMIDGLALGETTPGPLIMVLAFVGFMAGYNHFGSSIEMGTVALVTTTFYTFLPCFLFIFVGAPIIEQTQENKKLKEIFSIVTAAVVGMILNLTIYLSKAVIFPEEFSFDSLNYIALGWIIISIIAMYSFKIGMVIWIGVSAIFGLLCYLIL